jgi:hypothetical protein
MEVVLLSVRGSRAALTPAGAAGVAEGAPGALVVLAVEGTAGVGVLDTGGIPVHLLLGPFSGPTSAQGWNDDRSPAEVRGGTTSMLARYTSMLSKKIRAEDCVPSTLHQQGGDQFSPCLHKVA